MKKLFLPALGLLTLSILSFPQESFAASKSALELWWKVVLPSLLPFFIISELLISLGAMRYMGKWLEPLMRPLFNLPGSASLAVIMGFTSGFPSGANITAGLRRQGLITRNEGNRLLAFTNNASPLFIMVSVATGILHTPKAGVLLACVHYGCNLCVGILLGIFSRKKQKSCHTKRPPQPDINREPLGTLLKSSAQKAFANITLIGCYLVFFSVIIKMLSVTGIIPLFSLWLGKLLAVFGVSPLLGSSFASGIWEITLGISQAAESSASFSQTLAACSALISWGGFSVQAQAAAMCSDTDISIKPYLISCFVQMLAAFKLTAYFSSKLVLETTTETAAIRIPEIAAAIYSVFISLLVLALLVLLSKAISRFKHEKT